MNWIQDKHDRTIFRCSNCNSEIEVDKGMEIPGYCKHCEGETEDITEIERALECLAGKGALCTECAYDPCEFPRCKERAAIDALRLINRQQAKIEFDRKRIFNDTEHIKSFENAIKILETRLRHAGTEATKKFADELETELAYLEEYFIEVQDWSARNTIGQVINKIREMVGEG